jgi:hypothetical protein
LGLVVGGVISGAVIGVIAQAQRRAPPGGWNLAVAFVLVVYVFGLGWDSETPIRLIIWLAPLWAISWYISRPEGRATTVTESVGAAAR